MTVQIFLYNDRRLLFYLGLPCLLDVNEIVNNQLVGEVAKRQRLGQREDLPQGHPEWPDVALDGPLSLYM